MLSIFICDDDAEFLERVKQRVENYVLIEDMAMSVVCAAINPADVVEYLKNNENVAGLYFLDLDLGCDINGIKLAEHIREYDPRGFIVFITTDGDSYRLTFEYKVEAMDYIVKGDLNLEARIHECIRNAQAKLAAKATPLQDNFVFKISKGTDGFKGTFKLAKDSLVSIDSTRIMYFETSADTRHTVVVYTTDGRFEFRGTLSQIEKGMDKTRFFRCQRNLIVNLEKVAAIDAVQLKMTFENGLITEIAAKQVNKLSRRVRARKAKMLGDISAEIA